MYLNKIVLQRRILKIMCVESVEKKVLHRLLLIGGGNTLFSIFKHTGNDKLVNVSCVEFDVKFSFWCSSRVKSMIRYWRNSQRIHSCFHKQDYGTCPLLGSDCKRPTCKNYKFLIKNVIYYFLITVNLKITLMDVCFGH